MSNLSESGRTALVVATIGIVLALAFACVLRPALDRVVADEARLAVATQTLETDRIALAHLRAFPSLRRRYREEIGSVDVRSADAVLVADLLASSVREAARHDVVIVSLTAEQHAAPASGTATFREISLVMTQEGRYADILASLDALSRAREIVRVDGIDLARAGDAKKARRDVRAVIALRLLRLDRAPAPHPAASTEPSHA